MGWNFFGSGELLPSKKKGNEIGEEVLMIFLPNFRNLEERSYSFDHLCSKISFTCKWCEIKSRMSMDKRFFKRNE